LFWAEPQNIEPGIQNLEVQKSAIRLNFMILRFVVLLFCGSPYETE